MLSRSLLILLLSTSLALAGALPVWQKLEGCQLVKNKWNDGDSFHVKTPDGEEFIYRLYFVDTPETDSRFPARVADQAADMGITPDQALKLGKKATEFTTKTLGSGPFTIWTCGQKALGSSKLQRWYGMIETKDGWLDQLLVKNGLARIHGKRITVPDGRTSREYLDDLGRLEKN